MTKFIRGCLHSNTPTSNNVRLLHFFTVRIVLVAIYIKYCLE